MNSFILLQITLCLAKMISAANDTSTEWPNRREGRTREIYLTPTFAPSPSRPITKFTTKEPPIPNTVVLDKLFDKYDARQHPRGWQKTSGADGNLEKSLTITVTLNVKRWEVRGDKDYAKISTTQKWLDTRLAFRRYGNTAQYITLPNDLVIWRPDTAFLNAVNVVPRRMVILLHSDGTVEQIKDDEIELMCEHNLATYPMDTQSCAIQLGSNSYQKEAVQYRWKALLGATVDAHVQTTLLHIQKVTPLVETAVQTYQGEFSRLTVTVLYQRELSSSIWNVFLPGILLVLASWIPMWMHTESHVSRNVLAVVCLALVVLIATMSSWQAPITGYITPITIWNFVICAFCFCALIESSLVTSSATKYRTKLLPRRLNEEYRVESERLVLREETPYYSHLFEEEPSSPAKKIDYVARVIFPLLFLAFNIIYWVYYLQSYINGG